MSRWLAIFANSTGDTRCAMITVPQEREIELPFGSLEKIEPILDDYSSEHNTLVLVEMPEDNDFRPMVVDLLDDEEAAMQFIDL